MLKFQAHKGVSTENPENTIRAYMAAIEQGYHTIEMDVSVTKDMQFVMLHDSTLSRCGRRADGSPVADDIKIKDLSFAEASDYDFGLYFSRKFKGERMPLFEDVLKLCRDNSVFAKIDNKYQNFTEEEKSAFFKLINNY